MKMAAITLALLASTAAWAKTDKTNDTVINDRFFLTDECDNYLASAPDKQKEIVFRATPIIVINELLTYVTSGDTLMAQFEPSLKESGISYSDDLIAAKTAQNGKRNLLDYFEGDEDYSNAKLKIAEEEFIKSSKNEKKELRIAAFNYISCSVIASATGFGQNANYFEKYIDFAKARPSKAEVGYFEVSANKAFATNKVGTGNKYAEPKQWEGSRFFVVNASFKNISTESRLPIGGSLFINYNGKDYEFDTVEPIMLEGYNIWFKSINPLITMKTKIVYRIPNEVNGEVFWRPGRNPTDTRLWVGKVLSVK